VLFVGVFGHGDEHRISSRLAALGAVPCHPGTPPSWDVANPSIVVFTGECTPKSVHLTVATDPDFAVDATIGTTSQEIDALWDDRLVPFESNLRLGRRAPRRQTAVLVDSDPTWPEQARRLIERLCVDSSRILRADHIGSTSVPGLPAKQLLDIQIVVADLADAAQVADAARRAGFVRPRGSWFGTDRYGVDHPEEVAVDADPARPVNVNIRSVDGPIWRETLLFRDWLRCHDEERSAYAVLKSAVAKGPNAHVDDYSRHKMPWISAALGRAEEWAAATNWAP
jgi:dephospho-CoA kinase